MIDKEELDDVFKRALAYGTNSEVLSDILDLSNTICRLSKIVEAAEQLNAERLKFHEAEQLVAQQRGKVSEAEAALEIALEKHLAKPPSSTFCMPHGWL